MGTNLTGQRFGNWNVLRLAKSAKGQVCWTCRCACGTERAVQDRYLRYGRSKSCGCTRSAAMTTHGLSYTSLHAAFFNAKYRCTNPDYPKYEYYGGRGIQFKFESVAHLAAEVGMRPSARHTLDRIRNDGHYESGNVRWATRTEQNKNRRKYGTLIRFSDEELLTEVHHRNLHCDRSNRC